MQLTQGQALSDVMELRLANRQIKQTEPALAKVLHYALLATIVLYLFAHYLIQSLVPSSCCRTVYEIACPGREL